MNRRKFFKISSLAAAALAAPSLAARTVDNPATPPSTPALPDGMARCKVTVLRRECFIDLQSRYLDEPEAGPCPLFSTGQEIILDKNSIKNLDRHGFCPKAWKCISHHVQAVLDNSIPCDSKPAGNSPIIACCNDGTRPVIFKIEAV